MKFSEFGRKFTTQAGIVQLMDDLGQAMAGGERMMMLGGGNPAAIAPVQACFRGQMYAILENGNRFERMIGNYDAPQGNKQFIDALAALLRRTFGWEVYPENIALTQGSQISFFFLLNMFGGRYGAGNHKKILLPLTPEYIGYADVGVVDNLFVASKPEIDYIDAHTYKYHINFDAISVTDEIGAICVSRPTNPTGNVLTDVEVEKLSGLAREHDIPLIIDNAYGTPFPNIIFTEASPVWDRHIILCMSLSKLGLPGVRTGIVIADEMVTQALTDMNAISSLAPSSFGPTLALDLVKSGEIINLSQNVIQPFYHERSTWAVANLSAKLGGTNFYIHKSEGAIFLWLWCKDMPISSQALYERLKARGVVVVPGQYFFPGLDGDSWSHKYECLRINYSQEDKSVVDEAFEIIADEVKKAYDLASIDTT